MMSNSFGFYEMKDNEKKDFEQKIREGRTDNMLILKVRQDGKAVMENDSRGN